MSGSALPAELAVVPAGAMGLASDLVVTAGSWERSERGARFTPRFPARRGSGHAVLGRQRASDLWTELARAVVPDDGVELRTEVQAIDPGGESIPANLLRFSVSFSAAMDEGSTAGHIHLLDESGVERAGALMEMPPELWDRDRRRLTILLEPGRIKRGLQPNVQAGAPLREGETVTLVVDSDVLDARGAPLRTGAQRTYRVGSPMRSRVEPADWAVRWPREPDDPLTVRFDRPLDRALVRRCLHVVDGDGYPVSGRASLDADALRWVFTPAGASGDWRLHIDTRLEDTAGNSVRRVFDRNLQRREDDGIDAAVIILSPRGLSAYGADPNT